MRSPAEILDDDRLWTVADVARFLGLSTSWVYKAAERGELPARKIGGRALRFRPEDIKAFVDGEAKPAAVVVALADRR